MKNIVLFLFLLFMFNVLHGQNIDNSKCRKEIEELIPLYLIDNYCSKTGLVNIEREAKVDERVYSVKRIPGGVLADSSIIIRYKNTVMIFEKTRNIPFLGNFDVYFQTKQQMDKFIDCYLKILDPTNEYFGFGLNNNVWPSSQPSDKIPGLPFSVTCFVWQWDYCTEEK